MRSSQLHQHDSPSSIGSAALRPATDAVTALQNHGIFIPHPDQVIDYLARHSDLVPNVVQICELAAQEFPAGTERALELFRDIDADDEYLTLYIRAGSYDDGIMQRIHTLWEKYEPGLADKSGWMLVTTDFGRPH